MNVLAKNRRQCAACGHVTVLLKQIDNIAGLPCVLGTGQDDRYVTSTITATFRLASIAILFLCSADAVAQAGRDYVYMVGSSTVFPFTTVVAERFGRNTDYRTPKVESTGTGGGFKLFCDGIGVDHPDITSASRRIKRSELESCAAAGVSDIVEIRIGYDGIVFANALAAPEFELSLRHIYLALARRVPGPVAGELIDNPYRRWSAIDPALPDQRIEILGPPPTSGTRDEIVEHAMQGGCDTFPWIQGLAAVDPDRYRAICHTVREDGVFIETGENDNLIVQKLEANPRAVGIFGFSFLDQNLSRVKGALIEGVAPTFDSIAGQRYAISRPLYLYVKKAHVDVIPGLRGFLAELSSERAWGDEGYLSQRGLITMPARERQAVAAVISELATIPLAKY